MIKVFGQSGERGSASEGQSANSNTSYSGGLGVLQVLK